MEERKVITTLECYIKDGDKYLMLKRANDKKILPGVMMGPGGKREFNEGLFECARREVREETGYEIKNLRIMCHGTGVLEDINLELQWHFLEAELAGGEFMPEEGIGEFEWLTVEEILEKPYLLAELKYILPIITQPNPPVISYKVVYSTGNNLKSIEIERG